MGWSIGYDSTWHRDIGYGVPATCDHPECRTKIDRGLSYVCGGDPYGGDNGCGLYFCPKHLCYAGPESEQVCERCAQWKEREQLPAPFDAKPDHPQWIRHKLRDRSWAEWRAENPIWVAAHTPAPADNAGGAA